MCVPANLTVTAAAVLAVLGMGCQKVATEAQSQPTSISEMKAKELALSQYRSLFGDKFLLNPVDGKYYPFPALSTQAFNQIEVRDDVWIVRAAPPSGVSVEARVDRAGRWTELHRVTFSAE